MKWEMVEYWTVDKGVAYMPKVLESLSEYQARMAKVVIAGNRMLVLYPSAVKAPADEPPPCC